MLRAYGENSYTYRTLTDEELESYIKDSVLCSDPKVIKKVVENWLGFNGSILAFDELVCLTDFINNEEHMKKTLVVNDFSYRNNDCCIRLKFKSITGLSYDSENGGLASIIKNLETNGFENFFLLIDSWQLYAKGAITNEEISTLSLMDEEESWINDLL